jgi:transposase
VHGEIPGKKFQRTNIVSGLMDGKVVAPFQYSGTTDSVLFEHWMENQLLPAIPEDTTIVLDRASFHRKYALFDIVESKSCYLEYLPAYSPDLNPIEWTLWANMKEFLRNYMARYPTLSDALTDYFQFK